MNGSSQLESVGTLVAAIRQSSASGRAAPGVTPFSDFLDDLLAEDFQIAWIARGDHALVDDHLRILPLGAGIDHIGPDRLVRRHPAALRDVRFDQKPGCMANGGNNLVGVEDVPDEFQGFGFDAQQIRIDLAARQHDRLVIGR